MKCRNKDKNKNQQTNNSVIIIIDVNKIIKTLHKRNEKRMKPETVHYMF